jgi:hypothetical protein
MHAHMMLLRTLLVQRCRTWDELANAGIDRAAVLAAIGELVAQLDCRILIGPLTVGLEMRPDSAALAEGVEL